jgi:50S ribosomal protein L16 3-hydroxylase
LKKHLFKDPWHALGGLSPEDFLKKYWQKKPLLVRKAFPDFKDLLTPDELAGLAMEPDIHARLVFEKGKKPWRVEKGPFDATRFATLPKTHWSLLVSRVNEYLDQAARLLETFNFIPHWRLDDLMISYAPPHGTVGPHVDSYDVFLIQGLGRRRWQIQQNYDPSLVAGADLRVLKNFKPTHSWELSPGDLLYLPPGVAHYGVALEDCMTYSIGFRAPSHRDVLTDLFQVPPAWLSDRLIKATGKMSEEDILYRDPGREPTLEPALIDDFFMDSLRKLATDQLEDPAFLARFALKHMTQSQRAPEGLSLISPKTKNNFLAKLQNPKTRVVRTHTMPLAYCPISPNTLAVGIGGTVIELPMTLRRLFARLTQASEISGEALLTLIPKPLESKAGAAGIDILYHLFKWEILEFKKN